MKYQAFISYKHSETSRKQAAALEKALKKYAKPFLKPPIRIFRDEKEIVPGDDLGSTIKNALHRSEYLIYLASKKAAEMAENRPHSPIVRRRKKRTGD